MFVDDYATPKPVPRAEPQERTLPLAFTGNTGEYFKIWIVNVFLTVLTLGIYSAWAKVRNKRYFYGNTLLDGAAFEYHATGRQLLPGRGHRSSISGPMTALSPIRALPPIARRRVRFMR